MPTTQHKRYRLKKDLPNIKAGTIFEFGKYFYISPVINSEGDTYDLRPRDVENNPEWFEPVPDPQPEPELTADTFQWTDEMVQDVASMAVLEHALEKKVAVAALIRKFKKDFNPQSTPASYDGKNVSPSITGNSTGINIPSTTHNKEMKAVNDEIWQWQKKPMTYKDVVSPPLTDKINFDGRGEPYVETADPKPQEGSNREWEIVSLLADDGKPIYNPSKELVEISISKNERIHSVKRLSDNEVFSIGDEIEFFGECPTGKISLFSIDTFDSSKIWAYCGAIGKGLNAWKKVIEPTYTHSQYKEAITNAFEASRDLDSGHKVTGYLGIGLKHKTVEQYLQTLNLK